MQWRQRNFNSRRLDGCGFLRRNGEAAFLPPTCFLQGVILFSFFLIRKILSKYFYYLWSGFLINVYLQLFPNRTCFSRKGNFIYLVSDSFDAFVLNACLNAYVQKMKATVYHTVSFESILYSCWLCISRLCRSSHRIISVSCTSILCYRFCNVCEWFIQALWNWSNLISGSLLVAAVL